MIGGGTVDGSDVQTLRVYPTHEGEHRFGAADREDRLQCTKFIDATMNTNFELVLDDQWYPDAKYTNEDDFCSLLVHGWELAWYWDSFNQDVEFDIVADFYTDEDLVDGVVDMEQVPNVVDIWFSRETGQADFCASY